MQELYLSWVRPEWAPPWRLFAPVWSVLYVLIIITIVRLLVLLYHKKVSLFAFWIYMANILLNVLYTPLQFFYQNMFLATIDVVLIVVTLVAFMMSISRQKKNLFWLQVPYLLRVLFAAVLQTTIWILNR